MMRWTFSTMAAVALVVGALVVPQVVGSLGAGTSSFPDPVEGRAVYDPAGAVSPPVEAALEDRIDQIEARSGAEVVLYLRIEPSAGDESNLADAAGPDRPLGHRARRFR
ncbi:MAG: TPM domain-containing protein [Candidatus Limnocylindria bacterium]